MTFAPIFQAYDAGIALLPGYSALRSKEMGTVATTALPRGAGKLTPRSALAAHA